MAKNKKHKFIRPSDEAVLGKKREEMSEVERMMADIMNAPEPAEQEEKPRVEIPPEFYTPLEPEPEEEPEPDWLNAPPEVPVEKAPIPGIEDDSRSRMPDFNGIHVETELRPLEYHQPVRTRREYREYRESEEERKKRKAKELRRRRRERPITVILVLSIILLSAALLYNEISKYRRTVSFRTPVQTAASAAPAEETPISAAETVSPAPGTEEQSGTQTEGADTSAESEDENNEEGSSYIMVIGNYSWTDARTICSNKGGHLAIIDDLEEYNLLTSFAESQGIEYLWVGCHRENGVLITEHGDTAGFYRWAEGEPSGEEGNSYILLCDRGGWFCVASRNDPLAENAELMSGKMAFFCEFDGQDQDNTNGTDSTGS